MITAGVLVGRELTSDSSARFPRVILATFPLSMASVRLPLTPRCVAALLGCAASAKKGISFLDLWPSPEGGMT
jgi:hypothetical protein